MARKRETKWLFIALTVLLMMIVAVIVIARMNRIASWPAIGAVAAPWFALSIVLRARPDDWGHEGKLFDWWSVPHFLTGSLFGLLGIGIGFVIPIAITWELVEVFSRVKEHLPNRIVDVLLAAAGWIAANLVFDGSFPVS